MAEWVVRCDDISIIGRASNRPPTWWQRADDDETGSLGPLSYATTWPSFQEAEAAVSAAFGPPSRRNRSRSRAYTVVRKP